MEEKTTVVTILIEGRSISPALNDLLIRFITVEKKICSFPSFLFFPVAFILHLINSDKIVPLIG